MSYLSLYFLLVYYLSAKLLHKIIVVKFLSLLLCFKIYRLGEDWSGSWIWRPLLLGWWYALLWFAVVSPSDTPLQWHHKFGHPFLQKLRQVLPIKSSITTLSYHLRKHHCASYPNHVNNKSSSLFYLIYSDVWGPCCVISVWLSVFF